MFKIVEKAVMKKVEETRTIVSHVFLSRKAHQKPAGVKTQMHTLGSASRMRVALGVFRCLLYGERKTISAA